MPRKIVTMKIPGLFLFALLFCLVVPRADAYELDSPLKYKAFELANQCRDEVVKAFDALITSGQLREGQVFDTFYVPIPNTVPQRYHTQYDTLADEVIRPILDRYLEKDPHFVFVIIQDMNGYIPTHNTKFSQPLTGNPDVDLKRNRAKKMAAHQAGLAASRNTDDYLLHEYVRDTGQVMLDLAVPIYIHKRHWGAVRIGFKEK